MKLSIYFGTDNKTKEILVQLFGNIEGGELYKKGIVGFVDYRCTSDFFLGLKIYTIAEVKQMNIDKLVILNAGNYSLIYNQLVYGYGFEKQMVTSANFLLNVNVLQKYEKESDAEIQHSISNIKTKNEFDVFCGYCPKPREKYIVEWDEKYDMPYVIFEGKRIYYPRNKQFSIVDGHQCVMGLEYEQQLGSPHTYITEHHNINDGDVVIDAGVCEGNFAIKYCCAPLSLTYN